MDSTDSSTSGGGGGGGGPQLPPGFRFHPTDEELVVHYLKKKTQSAPFPASIIADIDLYKFDPWELPAKAVFGEQEWYFFSPRERKYPNGARPNRAATSGYWKATGTDKPVLTSGGAQKVGVKKALVFYGGKPPRGVKTNWIMHEYRLADNKPPTYEPPNKRASLRLDDWVLCRIYKKSSNRAVIDHDEREGWIMDDAHNLFDEMLSVPTATSCLSLKRTLPCLYWNEGDGAATSSKRAAVSTIDNEITTTVVNAMADQMNSSTSSMDGLISQMQLAGGGEQSGAMPGPLLGEGAFRQPYQFSGLNWYS